jgi:hypothetical protein
MHGLFNKYKIIYITVYTNYSYGFTNINIDGCMVYQAPHIRLHGFTTTKYIFLPVKICLRGFTIKKNIHPYLQTSQILSTVHGFTKS